MIQFRWKYFIVAVTIFLIEIGIAIWASPGSFLRTSLGDILAICLVYFALRTTGFLSPTAAGALAVAIGFAVEACQFLGLAEQLSLQPGGVLHTMLGSTFSVGDLVMYAIGGVVAVALDRFLLVR